MREIEAVLNGVKRNVKSRKGVITSITFQLTFELHKDKFVINLPKEKYNQDDWRQGLKYLFAVPEFTDCTEKITRQSRLFGKNGFTDKPQAREATQEDIDGLNEDLEALEDDDYFDGGML